MARKLRGAYLSPGDFARYIRIRRAHERIRKAGEARTHAGRLKMLRAIEPEITPADVELTA